MASLLWLLIPVVAAVGASLWAVWAGRNRHKTGDVTELSGYERFREAMEKSHSGT
ncbi:hypothetical protein [Streptomyces sp. VRA16 Mangrove soil]|uniref:hypothetical protein n=1 Tax=Streptomyces sp. VRA16 Mangrove soil TaxID=2817434 RepID=UPI001A9ECC3D|nr:hypothetical protein [Streptomyces sp. VRA16 Mangrove soil]MBO1337096.1 hypothetical protein [Streptomyces sp. VRA16 Mangrove soil]